MHVDLFLLLLEKGAHLVLYGALTFFALKPLAPSLPFITSGAWHSSSLGSPQPPAASSDHHQTTLSPSNLSLKLSAASDQVTGRGLAVLCRGSRQRVSSYSCAPVFVGLCSPALFNPVDGYKETNRQHEIETEHESGGSSRGTRET